MTAPGPLRTGDAVRLRIAGAADWTEGRAALVSENGRSIAVSLGGGVIRTPDGGLLLGVIPLIADYDAATLNDLYGNTYELEFSPEPDVSAGIFARDESDT
jgi:hypothetical protein